MSGINAEMSRASQENFLETALVLSPYSHALINTIDVQDALDLKGVHTVITARDIPGANSLCEGGVGFPLFAEECVLYHSQPVAVVVAENEAVAREAVGLVKVDYKPKIPILGIDEALALKSFHSDEQVLETTGESVPEKKDWHEFSKKFTIAGHYDGAPRNYWSMAIPGKDGTLSIKGSIAHTGAARNILAAVLGVEKGLVMVQAEDEAVPANSASAMILPAIAGLAAVKIGLPVRTVLDQETGGRMLSKQNPLQVSINASYDTEGVIHRLEGEVFMDGGWEQDCSPSVMHHILHHLDGAYYFASMRFTGRVCRTHCLSSGGSVLGGKAMACSLIEEVIAGVAMHLEIDAEVIREKNLYENGARQVTPYGQDLDALMLEKIWKRAKALASLEERAEEIASWNNNTLAAKRGLALVPVKIGNGISLKECRVVEVEVCLLEDGLARVILDGSGAGNALRAMVSAVIEEQLGVLLDSVSIEELDDNPSVQPGCEPLYQEALIEACHLLRDHLRMVSVRCLEEAGVEISDIMELKFTTDGICDPETPDSPVPLGLVVGQALEQGIPMTVSSCFDPLALSGERCFRGFTFGAAAAEVLVDGLTGEMRVLRVDIVQEGDGMAQEHSQSVIGNAFMRGTGWVTCEKIRWTAHGEIEMAQDTGASIQALEVPPHLYCEALGEEIGERKNPQEAAFCMAICVREAIREAIVAFGGVTPRLNLPHPLSPATVYFSIEASDC